MNDSDSGPSIPKALRFLEAVAEMPWLWRLGAASLVMAGCVALRFALTEALGENAVYITFYPAIIVAALAFGLRGGLLAVVVAVAVTHTPLGGVQIASFDRPAAYVFLGVFLFNSATFILLSRLLHRFAVARRESDELIRLNAEQLGHFVEQAPAAMAMFDRDMRYLAASARWRDDYNLSRDVVGKLHYEVFPEIGEEWKEVHRRALTGECVRTEEDEFVRLDGTSSWLRWEVRPWRHPHDGIGGVVIFSEDISDRVRARQALRDSDQRLRFAMRAANAGAWEWDLQTDKGIWSEEFFRLLGLPPGSREPSFDSWISTIHPADRETIARTAKDAAQHGEELRYEWRMLDATGEERWLMSRGGPMRPEDRGSQRYMGVTIDVTDRKKAELASRDNESRLDAIVSSAMESIVTIDRKGAILSANPAARDMFGYQDEEMLGRNVRMLMPEPYRGEHDGYIANYLGGGEKKIIGLRRQVEGRRKDGVVFPLELTVGEAIVNGDRLFVGFMRDLTPIETERRRVASLRNELFHVSRLNDMGEVVAGLAHEVGQPIAAILNFSAAHRRAVTTTGAPLEPDIIARIEAQARRAAEILKRLRGFIEKRPPEHKAERLQDLIDDAVKLAFLRSRARIVRPPPVENAGLRVCVDAILIEQVLVNLLRNADDAVIDEPDPEIWIETVCDKPGMVTISVADNGAGVDPETATELFSAFYSTKRFGMGVGLAIGKTIVESHGGVMGYRPNAPRGAIFDFSLPLYAEEEAETPGAPS